MDGIVFPGEPPFFDIRVVSYSGNQTQRLGSQLGKVLEKNAVVCFFGNLGAGKTTFIKGLVSAITAVPAEQVNSPTFTYLNTYDGELPVYHFDLYRLKSEEDFLFMGFDEFFTAEGICVIEWSERIVPILPKEAIYVTLTALSMEERQIELRSGGR